MHLQCSSNRFVCLCLYCKLPRQLCQTIGLATNEYNLQQNTESIDSVYNLQQNTESTNEYNLQQNTESIDSVYNLQQNT